MAGGEDGLARAHVLPRPPPVRARLEAARDGDAVVGKLTLFLQGHRIGAAGHDSTGEHAQRGAGRYVDGKRVAGRGSPRKAIQARARCADRGAESEGEAVDRGVVEGGHVALADQRCREAAAGGRIQRHLLDAHDRRDPLPQQVMGRGDRDPVAAIGEAVLGERTHAAAGTPSRSRMNAAIAGTSSRPNRASCGRSSGSSLASATIVASSSASSGVPRSRRCTSSLG